MSETTRRSVARVGVDTAKKVIYLHAVDGAGQRVYARSLKREQFLAWCQQQLPPGCVVAMEACSGAHHWARRLMAMGLVAKLIAPHLVTPYRMEGKGGKNDATDAAAICEAASRPTMRFVPVKTPQQQGVMALLQAYEHWQGLDERMKWCDQQISAHVCNSEAAKRAYRITGIGELGASALTASVADFSQFSSGKQFGSWLGLVPRQDSSGGKAKLGSITKRGDDYLRTLLIQGAKSAVMSADKRDDPTSRWLKALKERVGWQTACVAMANKNARILWAVMTREQGFDAQHVCAKPLARQSEAERAVAQAPAQTVAA